VAIRVCGIYSFDKTWASLARLLIMYRDIPVNIRARISTMLKPPKILELNFMDIDFNP
jgi:hypothetical protein